MALNSAAISAGIASLSISGVTIKDISGIPNQALIMRNLPIMYPSPNNWKRGGNSEPSDGPAGFGAASERFWIFNRTYEYTYLHEPVGTERTNAINYVAMSAKEDAIITALLALDITDVDVQSLSTSEYGIKQDPTGADYYGFTVSITLREKVNA